MMAINDDYDIEIEDAEKVRREITNRETGNVLVFYSQKAWLNVGRRNDIEFSIPLSESSKPFPVGRYKFSKRNVLFSVNEYGSLQIARDVLYASVEFPILPVVASFIPEKKAA
jgi:hypothetical protein